MSSVPRDVLSAAAAGFAATLPMTVAMKAIQAALPASQQDPIPPRQITERAAAAVGVEDDMTEGDKQAAAAVAHLAFGAGAGGVYGLVAPHLPFGPALNGVGYGLAVWAGSYLGWLPATGLYKQPENEPAGRHTEMILSHVVWGAALGVLHHQLAGDDDGHATPRYVPSPAEVEAASRSTGA
ncbi:DUF6789 family protein [Gemmata sp.]|uniref:DUF6789 family protein n=1 Tax=Gemmata sp. TaxID=1914242 RepID=UPI003F6EE533